MSYPGLRAAATQFGRRIIAVEADKHGMVPEMLEEACRQHKPGLVYLNPTLQNPTAITIPERRRKELASIAKRCNVRIVEDDPYWLLADAPPPPIATFAPEQVVLHLNPVEMPDARLACRLRARYATRTNANVSWSR
jgi:DNA-binding transcriptional MocR family regulator